MIFVLRIRIGLSTNREYNRGNWFGNSSIEPGEGRKVFEDITHNLTDVVKAMGFKV